MYLIEADAELFGGDLRHHGFGALTHFHSATQHIHASVSVHDDDCPGDRRREHGLNSRCDALSARLSCNRFGSRRGPPDGVSRFSDTGSQAKSPDRRTRGKRLPLIQGIAHAEFHRIYSESTSDNVHLTFVSPYELGDAEAAKGARRRLVGVNAVGVD